MKRIKVPMSQRAAANRMRPDKPRTVAPTTQPAPPPVNYLANRAVSDANTKAMAAAVKDKLARGR